MRGLFGNLCRDCDGGYMTTFVKIIELHLSKEWVLLYGNYTSLFDL